MCSIPQRSPKSKLITNVSRTSHSDGKQPRAIPPAPQRAFQHPWNSFKLTLLSRGGGQAPLVTLRGDSIYIQNLQILVMKPFRLASHPYHPRVVFDVQGRSSTSVGSNLNRCTKLDIVSQISNKDNSSFGKKKQINIVECKFDRWRDI